MKLITIGSSKLANIKLKSSFVSSLHAEILLLDNGDIILTDKGSKNGTYVQNQRVEPEKDITVRRGDSIRFADVYLDWNMIPTMPVLDPTKVKGVYGVGSNFRNKYQLVGGTVSRFHATFKEMKNGQWFIRDHSRNGTTINGVRLTPEMDYRVKAKDVIVCGGVPCTNPVPGGSNGLIWKLAVAAVVVVGLAFGIKELIGNGGFGKTPKPEDMITGSALVYGAYHYTVTLDDDPFIGIIPDWPQKYEFGRDNLKGGVFLKNTMNATMTKSDKEYIAEHWEPFSYFGTAFFISEDGRMATNRHVATPWYGVENDYEVSNEIKQQMILLRNNAFTINELRTYRDLENLNDTPLGSLIYMYLTNYVDESQILNEIQRFNGYIMRYKNSSVRISGERDYIGVAITNHKYSTYLEFDRCTVVKVSDNPEIDLAIMQMNSGALPASVKFVYDLDKCLMNPKDLKPQTKTYWSIGYPSGIMLGLDNLNGGMQPTIHEVKVSKLPGEYTFQLQGENIGGCSGSPICDRKGHLIGVIWGKSTKLATGSYGVHAKYVKEMNDKIY